MARAVPNLYRRTFKWNYMWPWGKKPFTPHEKKKSADLLSCRILYFPHSLSLTLHLLIRSYAAEMRPRHSSFKHHYHNLLFCPFEGEASPRLKPTAEALHAYFKFIALKWLHSLPLQWFNEYMIESVYNSVNHSVNQSVVLSVHLVCLDDHLLPSWGVQFILPQAKMSQSIKKSKNMSNSFPHSHHLSLSCSCHICCDKLLETINPTMSNIKHPYS